MVDDGRLHRCDRCNRARLKTAVCVCYRCPGRQGGRAECGAGGSSLRSLVTCLGDERVGVVSGELVIREEATKEEAKIGLYWRYEKWMRKNLT